MSSTKYASAVAAIKAMENTLLTKADMEQLINAGGNAEADSLIAAKRSGSGELTAEGVCTMLREYAPDCDEMKILLYPNDFHNLKAALKAMIADRAPEDYYIRPTNIDTEQLSVLLGKKDYEHLPAYIRNTAEEAYELLTRTLDGQLADSLIDCAALSAMQKDAKSFGGKFIQAYAELITASADIKTAYRAMLMKKSKNFMEGAVCGSSHLDKTDLINAALGGSESFFSYLDMTPYDEAGKCLARSAAAFEKWADDAVMELAEPARMQAFGCEPLEAYYISVCAELKNLRILRVCREFGADRETITERMRKLYG